MRFIQRISSCLTPVAPVGLAICLFASGRPVSASEQQQAVPATPVAPVTQPVHPSGPQLQISSDDAVRMALENNLWIKGERFGPQIGTYGVAQARAQYAPSLFSTTTKRNSTSPPDFLTSGGLTTTTTSDRVQTNLGVQQNVPWGGGRYSVALDASRLATSSVSSFNPQLGSNLNASYVQPLLRNFRIDGFRQQVLVAKKTEEIADLLLRQQLVATERSVRSAYYDLVGALGQLDVARQSLDLSRESLRQNERRVEVGVMARIDIIEAQAEVARVEESVILAEASIRTLEDNLRTLILNPAQPDFWTVSLVPSERPVLTAKAVDVDAATRNALSNRTDLAEARKRLDTTDINLGFARNQKLPAVDLVANYNTVGVAGTQFQFGSGFPPPIESQSQRSFTDALRDVFGNQFKTWSVQLLVSYPIGTSPASAALAAGRLQREQQLTGIQELEVQITASVRDAGRQVSTSLQRVDATRKAREFAEIRLDAEQKRVTAGLSTTFQLLNAQRDLASAKLQENRAIIDYNRALVNFEAVQTAPGGGR
ncbi:MAG: TolC family protein [Vicinamibacterales bacterium]